jgi:hypothetical protein
LGKNIKEKRFYFFLRPLEPTKRTYYFYAETKIDFEMWKEVLIKQCDASVIEKQRLEPNTNINENKQEQNIENDLDSFAFL